MKLSTQQLAIVSKLIDLNDEYFQAKKMHNPIQNQINRTLPQKDFVNLRHQIEDFFNQRYYPTKR